VAEGGAPIGHNLRAILNSQLACACLDKDVITRA